MSISLLALLPLVQQLGGYLQQGLDLAVAVRSETGGLDVDKVTLLLAAKMAEWNPTVLNRTVLDDATRMSAARFLAGVACNLTR